MKDHYGKEFVDRIAKQKSQCRTKRERHEIQDLIRTGRRMERRTARQKLRQWIDK